MPRASYDFDNPGMTETTVRIFDVAGATKDSKEIIVKLFRVDTDGDGCGDEAEMLGGRNPSLPDPQGDVNGDCFLDLKDAVIALQVATETVEPSSHFCIEGAVNGGGEIGLEEALYALQRVSEVRP